MGANKDTFASEHGIEAHVGGEEAPFDGHLHFAAATVEIAARTGALRW